MDETIVKEWLKSLSLVQYAESFIDNGYDDLEICKQIETPDLDAIGVVNLHDKAKILQAVWKLKVEGAASVYFTIEEAQAAAGETNQDTTNLTSERIKNRTSSPSLRSNSSNTASEKLEIDAYEAGRAELVRFPKQQLQNFIEEELVKDGINLTIHPYSSPNGERGILEGLASRYADVLSTHYQDVLEHLENIRAYQWNKFMNISIEQMKNNQNLELKSNESDFSLPNLSPVQTESNGDSNIYIPGKYNPSSCLSDAEEDQIYGFTKGVCPVSSAQESFAPGYLNPRSQCIYELPPSQKPHNGTKRRLGIGRFLKTLKRDLRLSNESKNRGSTLQKPNCSSKLLLHPPDVTGTPLVVLPGYSSPTSSNCSHSSKSHSSIGQPFVVTSVSAPGTPGSSGPIKDSGLQNAIEKLKEEEILRRRENQYRDQKQILEDVRNGLMQSHQSKSLYSAVYSQFPGTKNYAYENEILSLNGTRLVNSHSSRRPLPSLPHHWYDEPPYESDPEDFMINSVGSPDSKNSPNSRLKFALDEDVISLKTAGDISLPRDLQIVHSLDHRRSILTCGCNDEPHHQVTSDDDVRNNPKPSNLTPRIEEHRNYLKMEGLRPGSRVDWPPETQVNRPTEGMPLNNVSNFQSHKRADPFSGNPFNRYFTNSRFSNMALYSYRSDNWGSPKRKVGEGARELLSVSSSSVSSFNEDREKRDSESLMGRMKMLQRDMQKKISCLKNGKTNSPLHSYVTQNHSVQPDLEERLAGAASTFARRQNSLPVKLNQSRVRALVDYRPLPGEENALGFKKGNIIDILGRNPSGLWQGHLNGKVGLLKSSLVEEIEAEPLWNVSDRPAKRYGFVPDYSSLAMLPEPDKQDLQSLLVKCGLEQFSQTLIQNGFKSIGQLLEIRPNDLNQLGILEPDLQVQVMGTVNALKMYVRSGMNIENFPQGFNSKRIPPKISPRQELPRFFSDQNYENTSRLDPAPDEACFEPFPNHSLRSSSSTDTSSGYHSRQFNLPVATSVESPMYERSQSNSPVVTFNSEDIRASFDLQALSKRIPSRTGDMSVEDPPSYLAQAARVHSPASSNSSSTAQN